MYLPAATPVQPGHAVSLSLSSVDPAELAGLGGKPIDGTIVRVDRGALLNSGHLAVGVKFAVA
jgi:hypothetical protein